MVGNSTCGGEEHQNPKRMSLPCMHAQTSVRKLDMIGRESIHGFMSLSKISANVYFDYSVISLTQINTFRNFIRLYVCKHMNKYKCYTF